MVQPKARSFASTVKLTASEALEIYSLRPARKQGDQTYLPSSTISNSLASRFNVGERTIRDIWNRRSWREITRPLWTLSELAADPETSAMIQPSVLQSVVPAQPRKPGRPKAAQVDFTSLGSLQDFDGMPDEAVMLPSMGPDQFNTSAHLDFVVVPTTRSVVPTTRPNTTQRDTSVDDYAEEGSRRWAVDECQDDLSHLATTGQSLPTKSSSTSVAQTWQLSAEIVLKEDPFEDDWRVAMEQT